MDPRMNPQQISPLQKENGPYSPPCEHFVGRDAEITELKSLLDSHQIVQIVGEDGVGKLNLANSYAQKYEKEYAFVMTIKDIIHTHLGIKTLIQQTGGSITSPEQIRSSLQLVKVKFLFIFQDIDFVDPSLQDLFPVLMKPVEGHHMIFVRSVPSYLNYKPEALTLNPLSEEDSLTLFKKYPTILAKTQEEDLKSLVSLSKGNPTLIDQISTFFQKNPKQNIQEFVDKFDKNHTSAELIKDIVRMKLEDIKERDIIVDELLAILGFFHVAPIMYSWFDIISTNKAEILGEAYKDDDSDFDEMIKEFNSYGLIKLVKSNQQPVLVKFQRSILDIVREFSETNEERHKSFAACCLLLAESISQELEFDMLGSHMVNYRDKIFSKGSHELNTQLSFYSALHELFVLIYAIHDQAQSIVDRQSELLKEAELVEDNPITQLLKIRLYRQLGIYVANFSKQVDFDKSIEYLTKLEEHTQKITLSEAEQAAIGPLIATHLGFAYLSKKDYKKCIEYCELGLEDMPTEVETVPVDYFKLVGNLGVAYLSLSGKQNAKKSLERTLEALPLAEEIYSLNITTLNLYRLVLAAYGYLGEDKKYNEFSSKVKSEAKKLKVPQSAIADFMSDVEELIDSMKETDKAQAELNSLSLSLTPTTVAISGSIALGLAYLAYRFFKA